MRVFRYVLDVTGAKQTIDMRLGSEVLSVAPARHGYAIDMWVKVPEEAPEVPYTFDVYATGYAIVKANSRFIGTCVMNDDLVWHVFQEKVYP